MKNLKEIQVIDPHTVHMILRHPDSLFLDDLTGVGKGETIPFTRHPRVSPNVPHELLCLTDRRFLDTPERVGVAWRPK